MISNVISNLNICYLSIRFGVVSVDVINVGTSVGRPHFCFYIGNPVKGNRCFLQLFVLYVQCFCGDSLIN